MAQAHVASSSSIPLLNATAAAQFKRVGALPRLLPPPPSKISALSSSFKRGSPLFFQMKTRKWKPESHASLVSIRCEQGTKKSNGLDVWLGRLAMVGFATAITAEIVTGKGLLESFGLTTPIPTLALAVTALIGVLTAVFIFRSASRD